MRIQFDNDEILEVYKMSGNNRVQAIDREVIILKLLLKRTELKLSDIADELDLNMSTAHGIITTLKYHGFIDQDEETKKYRLGLQLLEFGSAVERSLKIRDIAKPYVDEVCSIVEETVHLGTLSKLKVIYLDKTESKQSIRMVSQIGSGIPAHCTGIGKAMLAYLDDNTILDLLPDKIERYTPNSITDKTDFLKECQRIRKQGYSLDNEECEIGLKCVAAPIFDYTGNAKYGISVSGPTIRMTDNKIQETINVVVKAAKDISNKLGYNK
jgi:DNA-binding IclR family transcriptional regulator